MRMISKITIYSFRLVDDVKQEMSKLLPTVEEQEILGEGVVLQQFKVHSSNSMSNKKVPIAGCRCLKGTFNKKARIKFLRNEEVIFDGKKEILCFILYRNACTRIMSMRTEITHGGWGGWCHLARHIVYIIV